MVFIPSKAVCQGWVALLGGPPKLCYYCVTDTSCLGGRQLILGHSRVVTYVPVLSLRDTRPFPPVSCFVWLWVRRSSSAAFWLLVPPFWLVRLPGNDVTVLTAAAQDKYIYICIYAIWAFV
jgi:hypothetical protein